MRDLLAKLQEAERQHQSERVGFEVRFGIWGEDAPGVGLLGIGTSNFLGMDVMSFWPSAFSWKG